MGELAKEYLKAFTTDILDSHKHPAEAEAAWVSFTLNVEHKDGAALKQKEAFSRVISE